MAIKQQIQWRALNRNLTTFFKAHELFCEPGNEVFVQSGATSQKPKDFPMVYVLRSQERNMDLHKYNEGIVYMWIEMWIKNASADTSAAYDSLEDLENRVVNALFDWVPTLPSTENLAAHVKIPEWKSDGDTIRPCAVSRMTLEINWKRSGFR